MKKNLTIILIALSAYSLAQNTVIERPRSGNTFSTSSEGGLSADIYVADDFVLTETTTLGEMDFWGFFINTDPSNSLESFNIIIYEDVGGEPASNPTQQGGGIVELRSIPLDIINLEINNNFMNFLNIPITQANNNNQITLDAGTYWFCAYATFTFNANTDLYWGIDRASIPDEGGNSRQYFSNTEEWVLIAPSGPIPYSAIAFALRDETALSTNDIEDSHVKTMIYPNPAFNEFRIKIPSNLFSISKGELHILSIDGKLVYSRQIEKSHSNELLINASNLSKGLYLIKLKFENTLITQKIIIK